MKEIYGGMADFYDTLVDQKEFLTWGKYLTEILKEAGAAPGERILEAGCGTGRITKELAESGYEVVALDCSEDMLRVAEEKLRREARRIRFVLADMAEFKMAKKCGGVTAVYDVVNYLRTEEAVLKFFKNSYENVKPGGVLTFDFSTPYHLKEYYGNHVLFHDIGGAAWIWDNHLKEDRVICDITLFAKDGAQYRRFDERHELFIWSEGKIRALLKEAGWGEIDFFRFGTKEPLEETDARGQCVARKK